MKDVPDTGKMPLSDLVGKLPVVLLLRCDINTVLLRFYVLFLTFTSSDSIVSDRPRLHHGCP